MLWDVAALAILFAILAAAIVWRYDAAPLQLWDESRNANNALEVALSGPPSWRWLVPTFGGVADHWNTKPPLLIWLMAAGLHAGLPPLLALRLPSWAAAFATVATVWAALRYGHGDRLAAFAAGALVVSSTLYVGAHAARTGDFDALETAFVAGYVLCGWAALRDPAPAAARLGWMAGAVACAALAVFSKGVAGLLAAPGLMLFALARPRALLALVRDARAWALGAIGVGLCGGYYLLRERIDPGYVAAVLTNEVGGRFLTVSDAHRGAASFYIEVLWAGFQPGAALLAGAALPLLGGDRRRSGVVLACGLSAAVLLLVLSVARSKLDWYATPAVPLLAVAAGMGVSTAARWARRRRPRLGLLVDAALVVGLSAAGMATAAANQLAHTTSHGDLDGPQFGYARLFDQIETAHAVRSLVVEDGGFANAAGFHSYNPVLQFYARRETARGLAVRIAPQGTRLTPGTDVATCDPWTREALGDAYRLVIRLQVRGCVLAQVAGP